MATVDVQVASRTYSVACRDGEEEHLRALAAIVDRKAHDAAAALGTLSESRQLLFASLLLADEFQEKSEGSAAPSASAPPSAPDPAVANALERLAERLERLADRLGSEGASA
jgi:cell division protein ZapA